MNYVRLERLGWTKKETRRVKSILTKAEKQKKLYLKLLEIVLLWFVVLVLTAGSIITVVFLFPLILLGTMVVIVPILLLLSTCIGLLYVHVLHDLKLESIHHHSSTFVLLLGIIIGVWFVLTLFPEKFSIVFSVQQKLVIISTFATGILVPYVAHWRINESS